MMRKILDEIGIKKVDYVISSLPFANFSSELRSRFLELIYETLKPGGSFIAYQYSRQMKPQLQKTFSQVEISLVPFNIPPAFVYTCRK
jgi:phospholipid N-methyltransferase